MSAVLRFPPGFLWGVSTSAYQIEGSLQADGRGPTIWDRFCAEAGRIAHGDTAAVACDHYRRYQQDVALLAGLGVGAYRFSIAWSRLQPEGRGPFKREGLAFYSRLVDELLAQGISPMPTLYHWDLPQALQDAGGWQHRDTAARFAEFAQGMARQLGDRVPRWITHNETFEHTVLGHALGTHAPGLTLGLDSFAVAHHLLLSHGLAVQALRAHLPGAAQVGIAQSMAPARPATGRAEDHAAAHLLHLLQEGIHCEPLLRGRYPEELATLGIDLSAIHAGDEATIAQRLDFFGINYYNPTHVQATPPGSPVPLREAEAPAHHERTEMGWPVIPQGLSELLLGLKQRHGDALPPLVITENGAAMPDALEAGGVDDPRRVAYLEQHLQALRTAMDGGVDVQGYFVWSLLDNFEWAEGYRPRFGLVHVDYATQRRTPKRSYHWYRDLIAAQA
ncbi:GH1 family beta-glucosidase [Aquabacterium sp.]|uniref:GH1 family beta-glucosidase n=1 Tax=Aquabacterium sp. TaxID=1872578 RepID=UPI0037836AD0